MGGLIVFLAAAVIAGLNHHAREVARRRIRGVVPARYSHCKVMPVGTSSLPRREVARG